MSINLVRMRFAAVAVKIETTPGQDAIGGTPANSDFIAADCEIEYDPVVVDNPELTGTLDKSPGIVGGLRPRIRIKVPLRGSGTAATAPEWGRLLRCCTMAETTTASSVGAPTAATAGTTTSLTLATPFGTTAQQYRGMPLLTSAEIKGQHRNMLHAMGAAGDALWIPETTLSQAELNARSVWGAVAEAGAEALAARDSFPGSSRSFAITERL